jgi:hypothetical protein
MGVKMSGQGIMDVLKTPALALNDKLADGLFRAFKWYIKKSYAQHKKRTERKRTQSAWRVIHELLEGLQERLHSSLQAWGKGVGCSGNCYGTTRDRITIGVGQWNDVKNEKK